MSSNPDQEFLKNISDKIRKSYILIDEFNHHHKDEITSKENPLKKGDSFYNPKCMYPNEQCWNCPNFEECERNE